MVSTLRERVIEAAAAIREKDGMAPSVGVLLGTGLGGLASRIDARATIGYEDVPHFPAATVDTHAGELILGTLAGVNVIALSGRFHFYEGYSLEEVTFPVRVAKELGSDEKGRPIRSCTSAGWV